MADRMQGQAHGGLPAAGGAGLEMSTQEGGGHGRAGGKHGAGDEHRDTVGQEVAGMMPDVEDVQHGRAR